MVVAIADFVPGVLVAEMCEKSVDLRICSVQVCEKYQEAK